MPSTESGLRYTESGRGSPVVLLDWTPWDTNALAGALASLYRVISVQPPEVDELAGSARDIAEAVAGVCHTAGLHRYTLIGTSLGADVGFRLALLYPASVNTLLLVSPSCVEPAKPRAWNTPELATAAMLAHPEDSSRTSPDPGRTEVLATLAERWREADTDAASLLPGLSCATLAVFGQEDRLVSRQAGQLWKERVPNCSVSYVYDAGHAVGVDRPGALTNVVMDFVERRETFIVEKRSGIINP